MGSLSNHGEEAHGKGPVDSALRVQLVQPHQVPWGAPPASCRCPPAQPMETMQCRHALRFPFHPYQEQQEEEPWQIRPGVGLEQQRTVTGQHGEGLLWSITPYKHVAKQGCPTSGSMFLQRLVRVEEGMVRGYDSSTLPGLLCTMPPLPAKPHLATSSLNSSIPCLWYHFATSCQLV